MYPAFVSLLADISCILLLSFFFVLFFGLFVCLFFVVVVFGGKVLLVSFSVFPPSFPPCVLLLSLVYWPFRTRLLACLIRAAILHFSFLHFSFRLHLSSVLLIIDLLYQSAAFIFLDGSRVSEGLVS